MNMWPLFQRQSSFEQRWQDVVTMLDLPAGMNMSHQNTSNGTFTNSTNNSYHNTSAAAYSNTNSMVYAPHVNGTSAYQTATNASYHQGPGPVAPMDVTMDPVNMLNLTADSDSPLLQNATLAPPGGDLNLTQSLGKLIFINLVIPRMALQLRGRTLS